MLGKDHMLNFLRKYQKVVFGMVTAALIVSISFFGSYGALAGSTSKEKDRTIGNAIDGSSISRLDINRMVRFLSTDKMDTEVSYKNSMPNFFNDGVIRKDFIQTGLAQMLVELYFEELKADLKVRLEKEKNFVPYAHPQAPFLSAEGIWAQFLPSLHHNLAKIKEKDFEISPENFRVLAEVYLESSRLPSSLLRRFLSYQESQYQWLTKDPYLAQGDLSLFHFHDVKDWFGEDFVEIIAQFIHNSSIYAKQKGYKVSYEEAKADLLKQGYDALSEQTQETISAEVLDKHWKNNLMTLGMTEMQGVAVWQKVMLFRKLFEDYGQSAFVDKMMYDEYKAYTCESMELQRYKLPKDLQVGDFHTFLKLQLYLEAIAKDKQVAHQLNPPRAFKTLEEIQKETPALLEKKYEVEIAHAKREDALLDITLKETWDWESEEENWKKLRAEFKELSTQQGDPLEILDGLRGEVRLAVDTFAKNEILKGKETLISKVLESKPLEKKTLHLSVDAAVVSLEGIHDNEALRTLLERAAVAPDEVKELLGMYTQDEKNYYFIRALSKPSDLHLLSFQEASDVLETMLDKKLKKHHKAAEAANPSLFRQEDGKSKDFSAVKNHIGAFIYKDLLEAIKKDFLASGGQLTSEPTLEFYATHRFYHFARESKADIEKKGQQSVYVQKETPYHLEAEETLVKRKEKTPWMPQELFSMQEETFSPLHVAGNGDISFFKVLKKVLVEDKDGAQEMKEGQRLLAEDAKRYLMQELLVLVTSRESIHLEKAIESHE
jgi:GcvH upstream region-like protein